jgi:transposase
MVRDKFNLTGLVLVGDRGMITKARITTLRGDTGSGLGWLTALRAPAIKALAADGGPLQPTLFDEQDMAEISHPDYPGERLIACRNPYLAEERSRKRGELLHATEDALAPVLAAAAAGRLHGADRIGLRVGKIINKYKMAKHFQVTITDTTLQITRNSDQIASEAALDGIYVLRTSVSADQLDAAGVVTAYKNLANLERDFRSLKVDDLDLRPIYHRLEDRVRAHVFICMLAGYLTWHLRKTLAPLTFTDTQPPTRDNPVASATRSTAAERKASRHRDSDDNPIWSFRGLLDHLATLTRNQVRVAGTEHTVTILAEPTVTQQRVFELLNRPLPLTFK